MESFSNETLAFQKHAANMGDASLSWEDFTAYAPKLIILRTPLFKLLTPPPVDKIPPH